MIHIICIFIIALVAIKAITIGSDFNFYLLFKYRNDYLQWYRNRPKYHFDRKENKNE